MDKKLEHIFPGIADNNCLKIISDRRFYVYDNPDSEQGNIDLAFHLETDDGGNVIPESSHITLEKTILFPKGANVSRSLWKPNLLPQQ